jgi:hypothetical protein
MEPRMPDRAAPVRNQLDIPAKRCAKDVLTRQGSRCTTRVPVACGALFELACGPPTSGSAAGVWRTTADWFPSFLGTVQTKRPAAIRAADRGE